MTKRLLLHLALGAGLLLPTLALAQEKPSLNTAPPAPTPVPVQPAPAPATPAPTREAEPASPAATPPALPPPSYSSPSGFELPQREQDRKAAQQHAEMYSKLFIYSGIGLGYSSNYYGDGGVFNFSISPALGYRINDRIAVGPGISYSYINYSGLYTNSGKAINSLSLNNIGYKVFGQAQVYKQFLVHAEYEVMSAELPYVDANNNYVYDATTNRLLTGKRTVTSPLAGVGYRSQISNRAAADILLLYNFNDGVNYSLYSNPVIRFNFLFNIGK